MTWVDTDVEITTEEIELAKTGEAWAQELVMGSLTTRIRTLADNAARRADVDLADDLFQTGLTAVWGVLATYEVTTVDAFRAYMYRVAQISITHALTGERHQGVDRRAIEIFGYWVRQTGGDLDLAQRLSQESTDGGGRLGRDRAWAARQSWTTTPSLDAERTNEREDSTYTLADLLISDLGIPDEFLTSDDLSKRERATRIALVRAVLDSMGSGSRDVLMMTYGVDPHGEYGSDNEAIGSVLGKTSNQIKALRNAGHKAFATKYIPLISDGNALVAQAWWDAYNAERAR
jgi:RNA polymerase sigma factor (sigma-70 family)